MGLCKVRQYVTAPPNRVLKYWTFLEPFFTMSSCFYVCRVTAMFLSFCFSFFLFFSFFVVLKVEPWAFCSTILSWFYVFCVCMWCICTWWWVDITLDVFLSPPHCSFSDSHLASALLRRKQKEVRTSHLNMEGTNWLDIWAREWDLPARLPELGLQHMLAYMFFCEHWGLKLGFSCLCCKLFTQWAIPSNQVWLKMASWFTCQLFPPEKWTNNLIVGCIH